jgi:predicted nuclease of predicted toxin-antitoxin system
MRVLIDECVPRKLKFDLSAHGHQCFTVQEAGFAGKRNGELLALAENAYDLFFTLDKNLRYQQNLTGRKIAVLVVRAKSNRIADVRAHLPACLIAMSRIKPGQVVEVPTREQASE